MSGLRRVAKQCGGITVTSGGKTVRYDADGNPRHPVDAMKALGVPMTPEFEAQARAICDEAVELPQEIPARFQHSERSAIEP